MSTNKLLVINHTLRLLSKPSVAQIDSTEASQSIALSYDNAVDRCFERNNWNFAARTYILERSGNDRSPYNWDWVVFHKVPSAKRYVRIFIDGDVERQAEYRLDGDGIHTSDVFNRVRVVERVPEGDWPAYFAEAVAYALAAEFSSLYGGDDGRNITVLADDKFARARIIDQKNLGSSRPFFDTSIYINPRNPDGAGGDDSVNLNSGRGGGINYVKCYPEERVEP